MIKHFSIFAVGVALLTAGLVSSVPQATAQSQFNYRVTIYNLTNDQVFSPPVVATHTAEASIFAAGTPASAALRALAEDGLTGPLTTELGMSAEVLSIVAAAGPIPPGGSASVDVAARGRFDRLSAAGMLVTTNDAFFGLDGFDVDFDSFRNKSSLAMLVPAYDAGTESNNEMCAFIPGPPCGNPGNPDVADAEGYVHVHRGIHGGADLDPAQHDWRNPVAKIVVSRLP